MRESLYRSSNQRTADANNLPGCFFLAIKSTKDGPIKFKARLVVSGHRDKMKKIIVKYSKKLQPISILVLLYLAAIN